MQAYLNLEVSINWTCPCCGSAQDRDINAARFLAAYAVSFTGNVCGGSSSDQVGVSFGETAPTKQKVNMNIYL